MRDYNLHFIANEQIYGHVKQTVEHYISNLKEKNSIEKLNANILDPIKLTFDMKVYGMTVGETLKTECLRQIDKSNNNNIGYFHQNLFKYAGNGWTVPGNGVKGGFDVCNDERHIYAEIKNKHNTMNSSAATATYLKLLDKMARDSRNVCYLVEVISKKSQDEVWRTSVKQSGHTNRYENDRIRRISMDRFYGVVFGDKTAFARLCKALPDILDDVLEEVGTKKLKFKFLKDADIKEFNKTLLLLAFSTYDGFDTL